jgi:chromate reductase
MPDGFGTVLAQNQWLSTLRTLGTRPWLGGRLLVSRAQRVFNDAGEMVDEAVHTQPCDFLHGLVHFIQTSVAPRS